MTFRDGPIAIGGLLAFSAWLFIGLPWLTTPSHQIRYYENAHNAAHASEGEPRGTAQAPFFVQVIPSPKTAEERTAEAEEKNEKRESDRWLVIWTCSLFFATVGLILATAVLGYFAKRQARDIRDQIKLARDEFNSTHRPRIRAKHLVLANAITSGQPVLVDLVLSNRGPTPGFLNEYGLRLDLVPANQPLPVIPAIEPPRVGNRWRIEPGLNHTMPGINIDRPLSIQERNDLLYGRSQLYCIGYISYFDSDGRMRITGFCRKLEFILGEPIRPDNSRFRPFEDPDYEYED